MQTAALSLADWVFMLFVLITLGCLATRRDALLPTSVGLLVVGSILKGSIIGGLQVAFNAIMTATTDLLNVIIVIALIVMLTKTMEDMGSDRLMVAPLRRLLRKPGISYWVLGLSMLVLSWFIWPTPAVALLGALVLPAAVVGGLPPISAAMSLSVFGEGIGLSSDFIIQGTPSVTAKLTKIPITDIISANIPVWAAVSITAAMASFIIARRSIKASHGHANYTEKLRDKAAAAAVVVEVSLIGRVMAWCIPMVFCIAIFYMFQLGLKGGQATALVGGTALSLTMISAVFQYGNKAFERVMEHARYGWMFAVKVFGPVVIIAGFFWLGGDSLKDILGVKTAQGLMFDWGYFIAAQVPINTFMVAVIVTIASALAAFSGSGYAAIPLGVSIAMALGTPIGANVDYLASMAQMAAVWTAATLVPWGSLAVTAAMAGVEPHELARRNLWPTILGLAVGIIVTTILA